MPTFHLQQKLELNSSSLRHITTVSAPYLLKCGELTGGVDVLPITSLTPMEGKTYIRKHTREHIYLESYSMLEKNGLARR